MTMQQERSVLLRNEYPMFSDMGYHKKCSIGLDKIIQVWSIKLLVE